MCGMENRRIGWRNLRDAREHGLQSGRGSNDLFEHRRPVDFFAEGDVFVLQSFLSSLPVFDIGTRNMPAQDLSLVADRVVPSKKPTIVFITPAHSHFDFKRRSARHSTVP